MTDAVESSESAEAEDATQKPERAVQHTAPGVTGAKSIGEGQAVAFSTGDVIGGRFEIQRFLGASGGGVSYLSTDSANGEDVVIKVLAMPFPGDERFQKMTEQVRTASRIEHRNLTNIIGMGRAKTGDIFVAMEFVQGKTLSAVVADSRERGRTLSIRDTFTVVAHLCDALEDVHERMPHGVLTPYNVYLDHHGVVKVGNLAFARIAGEYLYEHDKGPFVDSIYVAPEVADAPDLISSAADIYSLGMITAELLSPQGLPADRKWATEAAVNVVSNFPNALVKLVSRSIGDDLAARPKSAADFRERFEAIAREMGTDLSGPPPDDGLPVEPAIRSDDDEENLFDIPELGGFGGGLGAEESDPEHERYLVQKGGLDYGPFTVEQVLEELYADDINENTSVLDRVTQKRTPLGEMERFKEKVDEYIPIREERKRREAEKRAELERKVKKGGVGLLVAGIVASVVVLGMQIAYYITRPDPAALPIQSAFAEMDYKFLPPPKDFKAVAVDKDMLENLFNPEASQEEIERAIKQRRKRYAKRRKKKEGGGGGGGDNGVTEVNMGAGSGTKHILSDVEVNDVILANFGALRSCMLKELKRDSGFRGVTVKFFIRPTGTTGGVKIKESKYQGTSVADCITSRFRSMKFPEHGGFNRGVTYPLRVQY